jgi:hypothetical protein
VIEQTYNYIHKDKIKDLIDTYTEYIDYIRDGTTIDKIKVYDTFIKDLTLLVEMK